MKKLQIPAIILMLLSISGCKKAEISDNSSSENGTAEATPSAGEAREADLLKSFKTPELKETDEITALKEKAETGDDEACETLGLMYHNMKPSRTSRQMASKYLRAVKKHQNAEAAYQAGLDEYRDPMRLYSPKLRDSAVKRIHAAARLDHIDALIMTISNSDMKMSSPNAAERINEIFEGKTTEKREGETLYQWAKALNGVKKYDAKRQELIKEAAESGSKDAKVQLAIQSIGSADIDVSAVFKTLSEASLRGQSEASMGYANLLLHYQNAKEGEYSQDQNFFFKTQVEQSGHSLDEIVLDYASKAADIPAGCQLVQQMAVSSSVKDKAANELVSCVGKYMSSGERDRCDAVQKDYPWEEMLKAGQLTDKQLKSVGQSLISCYEKAMSLGDDFSQTTGIAGPSTEVALAGLYGGSELYSLKENRDKKLAVLVYGASLGIWDAEWELSQAYTREEMPKDDVQACKWAKAAKESKFCSSICKENTRIESCRECKDISGFARKCK